MRGAVCWNTRRTMAAFDEGAGARRRSSAHAATCLRCQAEEAKYGRLRRGLAGMTGNLDQAPMGLVADVLEQVESESAGDAALSKLSNVAAAGAAAVFAAGTMVVLRRLRSAA